MTEMEREHEGNVDDDRSPGSHGDGNSWNTELERTSIEGYGTADVSASGVDRSQLRNNLRLTPTERVEKMVAFLHFVLPLQGTLRRNRD